MLVGRTILIAVLLALSSSGLCGELATTKVPPPDPAELAARAALRFVKAHQREDLGKFLAPWTKQPQWKKQGSFFTVVTPFAKVCLALRSSATEPTVDEAIQVAKATKGEGVLVIARFPTIALVDESADRWWRQDDYSGYLTVSDGNKSIELTAAANTSKSDLGFTMSRDGVYWRDYATRTFTFDVGAARMPKKVALTFEVRQPNLLPRNGMWAPFFFERGEFLQ